MTRITIACDVDGVLAPVHPDPMSLPDVIELPRVMHGTHVLVRTIEALKLWHRLGAQVMWHTTWRPPYTDDLEHTLTLPTGSPPLRGEHMVTVSSPAISVGSPPLRGEHSRPRRIRRVLDGSPPLRGEHPR